MRQHASFASLLHHDGRAVRAENHRVFQRDSQALAKLECHHDNLSKRHRKDVLFLCVVQEVFLERATVLDELEAGVKLPGLWDEEHLESIKETLVETLLVDKVAGLDLIRVVLVFSAFLFKLLNVGSEDVVASVSFLFAFLDEFLFDDTEVFIQIEHSQLLLRQLVSLVHDLVTKLLQ